MPCADRLIGGQVRGMEIVLRCNMSKEQDNDCTKKVILLMHAAVSKPVR
jgi:hypothetical protein